MKKVFLFIIFALFLIPTFVFAETYYIYDLNSDDNSFNTNALHEGDIIQFSNPSYDYGYDYYYAFFIDGVEVYSTQDETERNLEYIIPTDCFFGGIGQNSTFFGVYLYTDNYNRTIMFSDMVENQIFKSGDLVVFDHDNEGDHMYITAYMYDTQQELVNFFIVQGYDFGFNRYVFPKIDGKDAYWKVSIFDDGLYRTLPCPHFYQIEFQEPAFSIDCKDSRILYGQKTSCTLSVQFEYDLQNVHFNLNLPNLNISNVTYPEEVESLDGESEYNLKINDGYVTNNRKVSLMHFDLEGTKNETYLSDIHVTDIYYKGNNYESSSEGLTVDLNIEPVNNPKTLRSLISIILPVVILIGLLLYMNLFVKKKKES